MVMATVTISWTVPTMRHAPEQLGLRMVLGLVVEENFTLYLDGSREEGNHVSAGPSKSQPYFSPAGIYFAFKRKGVHAWACYNLSVSTRQGPYGAGRLRACSNRHWLHFNTCNELGAALERDHVERAGSPGAEGWIRLRGAGHRAP